MITTVFFDVGGTLIHPDLPELIRPLLEKARPEATHFAAAERVAKRAQLRNGNGWRPEEPTGLGAHAGPVNKGYWQVFFETLLDEVRCDRELLATLTARAGNSDYWSQVDPTASATLQRLQSDFRLAVISNADGRIDGVLRRAGLRHFFEAVVDSGLAGYEKPDRRIFGAALQQMGVQPEESLYVGDVYAIDYCGARQAGLQALLLDAGGVYRDWRVERLSALGELPPWLARERRGQAG
jgi:putative hydrolase of the HAD superfamily